MQSEVTMANSKAIYLSKKGGGSIEVRITNTPKVKLVISKRYENNLRMAQRYGYQPADNDGSDAEYASYDEGEDGYDRYSDAIAGDVIYSKEIDTRSLPKSNGGRILDISQFEDRLADVKGI